MSDMPAYRHARLVLVAVFVCGLARPAFADGALGVYTAIEHLIEFVLVLFALGLVVLIAYVIRWWNRRATRRKAESVELPNARVMNQHSRSESKQ